MKQTLHQILLGVAAIVLGPVDALPFPHFRITIPPQSAGEGVAFDFSRVSGDLQGAMKKNENANRKQFELALD